MSDTVSFESLKYNRGTLSIIDQLKLPTEIVYVNVSSKEEAWNVIRKMQVRGAPLIAIVAALGIAVDIETKRKKFTNKEETYDYISEAMLYLRTSRPTAVNLFRATDELLALINKLIKEENSTSNSIVDGFILAAEKMLIDDIKSNKAIGDYGAKRIIELTKKESIKVLTICNTGSLATAGYGTALGVVRSLHAMGKLEHVYACETRPYNQGARLTAFEIVQDKLPGTLIADSMAASLMAIKGIDCVIVGADRVTANGDTANKIGTYQLAIAAKYHGIPFFTAAPTTTLDLSMSSGAEIFVEERAGDELTSIFGHKIAPDGINVWNPAFDITPCSLITGVITEIGVAETDENSIDGIIDLPTFLSINGYKSDVTAVIPTAVPPGYIKMNLDNIKEYVVNISSIRSLLDITDNSNESISELKIKEIGDGNLNFVYIIESSKSGKKVIAKQALPYIRCIGESWPLSVTRAGFECKALQEERKYAEEYVPEVYYFDESKCLIFMRYIEAPHIILRNALIQGLRFSTFAYDISIFLAKTLYYSSAFAMTGTSYRSNISYWAKNHSLCTLTEQVVFTDPYKIAPMNHWTSPQLDNFAEGIRNDTKLKIAANNLKNKFLTSTQALIHADLHTGSVMVKEGSTFVIDPEFAFYGPMGFDIGAIIANLLLSYFSQSATNGKDYSEWILTQINILYNSFSNMFLNVWNDNAINEKMINFDVLKGDSLIHFQNDFMKKIWSDSIGFAGMKMIRRIIGIAHVADLDSIQDADIRSNCEKRVLCMGRKLILFSSQDNCDFNNIEKLTNLARNYYDIILNEYPDDI